MKNYYIFVMLMFMSFSAWAQTGNIQGVISDENGISVPGATVVIKELSKGAVSDFDGKFTLVDIPEGNYKLVIEYLGYADLEQEVRVVASQTVTVKITLATEDTQLDEVQITGYSIGSQARALNTQKNKQNITNIVSTDQIGKFPDANIGDAVKRIPGITMQVDQGEARNIIVRGLSPQLNSVTLNGSRIPSAEGDNRNVQMDLIPSDMIQTIEV
ncbi:MAG: carboxypeptidase-like regulatory domain-containing protein, partial [Flavobacteriaceae bacterium]|nr:carboxypeptidase-like regulatory domain-containing protein [Flavobacteriaceae bacterium]